jgi:hypothetical protein
LSLGELIKNLVHALILLILFSKSSPRTTGNSIPYQDSVAEMTGQRVNWNRRMCLALLQVHQDIH